jgi:predicted DNA-binding protein (UPF0251 family)/DNA-directed RNA polymerase subunit RPC12/RpoP
MGRPHKERRIQHLPPITMYKPAAVPLDDLDEVVISFEEMEAIRLVDAERLDMGEAAENMDVSRPTLHRIVSTARQKVATALWQGRALRIEGGTFRVDHSRREQARQFACGACGHHWAVPFGTGQRGRDMVCPQCKSQYIHREG